MVEIISEKDLPPWIVLPELYLGLIVNRNDKFLPWYFSDKEDTEWRLKGIRKRYNKRDLFPFARKDGTDDIACWEKGHGEKVFIIHDFASPGWEQREIFNNFDEWYQWALKQQDEFN